MDRKKLLTIDVTPESNPFFEDLPSFTQAKHHLTLTRCHNTPRTKEPVSGTQDRIKHRLVEQRITHPLGHNHVYFFNPIRKLDILYLPAYDTVCAVLDILEGEECEGTLT